MPGKPPPVPTSNTFSPGKNKMTLAIPSECNTWRSSSCSMSLREITLIWSFQNRYSSGKQLNCCCWAVERSGKYFSNRSDVIPVKLVNNIAEQVTRPEELGLHRSKGQIKLLGYFFVRELIKIAQCDQITVARGQTFYQQL